MACLGVPEEDWRHLAKCALEALELQVAKRAIVRLADPVLLRLVRSLQVTVANWLSVTEVFSRAHYLLTGCR